MSISLFFTVFSWFLGGLIIFYSTLFFKDKKRKKLFFVYTILSLLSATGAFFTDNIVHFLVFWGSLLVLLYAILGLGSLKTASKALTVVGLGDFCLILGVVFLITINKSPVISEFTPVPTDNFFNAATFLLIATGAMAKAGIFGFHNWIVDAAKTSSPPAMAFLPGCLDKFLGIYLFVKVCKDFFIVNNILSVIVMGIGALTILLAVLLALVQHDLKKLLAYHAVSQVGYMILGIASGTLIGIAGGLFHMLNHTIYKSSLFLNAGNIEYRTGRTDLSALGGLSKLMPATFVCSLIASFAISGIPPLNGFVSKWMIYQALIPVNMNWVSGFRITFVIIAMFGSALTLASFVKVIYSAFLSRRTKEVKSTVKEVSFAMLLPIGIMSALCVAPGVFAVNLAIRPLFEPMLGGQITPLGFWNPSIATGIILLGIILGLLIFWIGKIPAKETSPFIGGEELSGKNRVHGTEFYLTIKETGQLGFFYKMFRGGAFDFYKRILSISGIFARLVYYCVDRLINLTTDGLGKLVFVISAAFKKAHTGVLDRYVTWIIMGLVLIMGVLFRCLNYMR